jgi:hypothetical protein
MSRDGSDGDFGRPGGVTPSSVVTSGKSNRRSVEFRDAGPASLRIVGYFGEGGEAVLDSVKVAVEVEP